VHHPSRTSVGVVLSAPPSLLFARPYDIIAGATATQQLVAALRSFPILRSSLPERSCHLYLTSSSERIPLELAHQRPHDVSARGRRLATLERVHLVRERVKGSRPILPY
jgi:hypothetical protein